MIAVLVITAALMVVLLWGRSAGEVLRQSHHPQLRRRGGLRRRPRRHRGVLHLRRLQQFVSSERSAMSNRGYHSTSPQQPAFPAPQWEPPLSRPIGKRALLGLFATR